MKGKYDWSWYLKEAIEFILDKIDWCENVYQLSINDHRLGLWKQNNGVSEHNKYDGRIHISILVRRGRSFSVTGNIGGGGKIALRENASQVP